MSVQAFQISLDNKRICLIIGLGLIGKQIAHHMSWYATPIKLPNTDKFDWHEPKEISSLLRQIITTHNAKFVEIIWSAGKAGFSASNAEMEKEFTTYSVAIHTLNSLDSIDIHINLLSSAGGIYENSHIVNDLSKTSPSRPYAFWKLKQEQLLHELKLKTRIYRISSVYGVGTKATRSGLINNLIKNTRAHRTTSIYAHQNTLRDYIFNNDIAQHITKNIIQRAAPCIELLASGRATSINMLINMVRNITKQPVKATFVTGYDNEKDIIFSTKLIPKSLKLSTLEEGVRIINAFSLIE